jgi:hypothetical protein
MFSSWPFRLADRIDAGKLHDGRGGTVNELHQRAEKQIKEIQDPRNAVGDLFRLVHADPFRHHAAEHQHKKREHERQQDQREHLYRLRGKRNITPEKFRGRRGVLVCRERGGEKTKQRDRGPDHGQEIIRLVRHPAKGYSAFTPIVRVLMELCVVEGNQRRLAHRKKSSDADEADQKKQILCTTGVIHLD